MKSIINKLLSAVFSLLVLAAFISVKPMCAWYFYQPEVPEVLKKQQM